MLTKIKLKCEVRELILFIITKQKKKLYLKNLPYDTKINDFSSAQVLKRSLIIFGAFSDFFISVLQSLFFKTFTLI